MAPAVRHHAKAARSVIPSVLLDASSQLWGRIDLTAFQRAELTVHACRRPVAARQPVLRVSEANDTAAEL